MHEIFSSRQQAGLPLYQKAPGFNTARGFGKIQARQDNMLKLWKNNFILKKSNKTLAKAMPLT